MNDDVTDGTIASLYGRYKFFIPRNVEHGLPLVGHRCEFIRTFSPKLQTQARHVRVLGKEDPTVFAYAVIRSNKVEEASEKDLEEKYPVVIIFGCIIIWV